MKKQIFLSFILILISLFGKSQVKFENDTLTYNEGKYWVGKDIQLWYGSKSDKNFAFVFVGSGMLGMDYVNTSASKKFLRIDKIDKRNGKYYIRANFIENPIPVGRIFIDIEGATDNKEIKE